MRLTDARLWIALLSTSAVAWLTIDATRRTSPGAVTAVHARIPDVDGGQSCSVCHGGWFRSMTDACLACHEPIAEQLEGGHGLHGSLDRERAANCARCHSEHHGATFPMVNRATFAQAGIPDPERFDHRAIGFEMGGRHLELGCAACHLHAEDQVLPEGARRFLGLAQDCGTCHDDAHEGRMQIACADCHGQETWEGLNARGHDRHLALVGGHAEVGCRSCHATDGPHALERAGVGRTTAARACADCHESPHRDALVAGVAAMTEVPTARACASCHLPEHASFQDDGVTVTGAWHAATGFRLGPPHDAVTCAACHDPALEEFADRHPGRRQDDCRICHGDPHGGQFDARAPDEPDCVRCHEPTRFEPHAFTLERHAATALPLTGRHAQADCGACHTVPEDGGPRHFAGTPAVCAACHEDAHGGFFERAEGGGDCARCHGTDAFSPAQDGGFDHHRDAGFALRGAHAQSGCEACHPGTEVADARGRRFGRVADCFGPFQGCATCHADPHAGHFDRAGTPTAVDGRTGCARCHVESSFRSFPDGFDHGRWTGYPLTGAHAAAACTACHAPRFETDRSGRTTAPARGVRCDDCHRDPHAGQFVASGRTDCARCHVATDAFTATAFDHDRDSRFPLSEAHRRVACAGCHKPFEVRGTTVVRYRPLPTGCADCHGRNEDPLRRARRLGR